MATRPGSAWVTLLTVPGSGGRVMWLPLRRGVNSVRFGGMDLRGARELEVRVDAWAGGQRARVRETFAAPGGR